MSTHSQEEKVSSGVGSTNQKNRYEETIRRQREEYQKKESELVRKHNKEVRRLNESYQAEIDHLKSDNVAQQGEYARRARQALTTKDNHYKDQISKLKHLHRQQYSKLKEEGQHQLEMTREANNNEKTLERSKNSDQLGQLEDHYKELLRASERNASERIEGVRDAQKEALKSQRNRHNESHDKEVTTLSKMYKDQSSEKQRAYDDLRQNASLRQKSQEIRHLADKQRISDSHLEQMARKEVDFNEQEKK